mmetsp:Transcript_27546/g.37874  ORF Transcript_27546/g.37874 Transcript_27546/m.37874 type:complete len:105 (+) Transcript_27546:32-346(+)
MMISLFLCLFVAFSSVTLDGFKLQSFAKQNIILSKHSLFVSRRQTALQAKNNEERKISRENEGEFFESEFDRAPIKDRLPLALGVLAGVSLPFVIGLIYLYSTK